MFKFLRKHTERLYMPMKGALLDMQAVPDPMFSGKMLGDGFAVDPTDGVVKAPVEGTIVQIFPTNHAFGVVTDSGLEILVHIGIDTVELKGEGFKRLAEEGQKVSVGTPVIEVDLDLVRARGKSVITPVVITNFDTVQSFKRLQAAGASDPVAEVVCT